MILLFDNPDKMMPNSLDQGHILHGFGFFNFLIFFNFVLTFYSDKESYDDKSVQLNTHVVQLTIWEKGRVLMKQILHEGEKSLGFN